MKVMEAIKSTISENKYSCFLALGGVVMAAAIDAGIATKTSAPLLSGLAGSLFLGNVLSQVAGRVIFNKDPDDSINDVLNYKDNDLAISNKERNTLSLSAFTALGSHFIAELIKTGVPLQNSVSNLIGGVEAGGAILAATMLINMGVKTYRSKKAAI